MLITSCDSLSPVSFRCPLGTCKQHGRTIGHEKRGLEVRGVVTFFVTVQSNLFNGNEPGWQRAEESGDGVFDECEAVTAELSAVSTTESITLLFWLTEAASVLKLTLQ